MDSKRFILALTSGLMLSFDVLSTPSLNEMQECQAAIDFVVDTTDKLEALYSTTELQVVREGLVSYEDFIQQEIITPGLLAYSQNDVKKVEDLQQQIDEYKRSITLRLTKHYGQERLFTDYAVMINGCAQKALPSSTEDIALLKNALETIIRLAQQ
ncbi:hypothetical protein [Marinomonas sp.]